ncbi:MFS transporter [Ensifer sp. YR511]|uniref:MFS transporter n=1 Tax=Ensifer sp. YR511 TaxID=1855294 RepID=UPI0008920762|nr:MFS transporter [Ensifer sp. YR511]SDN80069.1 Predicted arabinose efflux permease, MFS family [Ensifer sp. YR511]
MTWTRTASESSQTNLRKVIVGASLGTVFEWYDFFIYALLASVLARQFFAGVNETAAFIVTLLSFAAGTAIRPLGAVIFGRLGDIWGRKRTFLVTISLMGGATFCIGLLPGYATWGVSAAFLLVGLRLLQGFALGGEYGGAAIYVAEHSPPRSRGFYTSWIQITSPLGQLLGMMVIVLTQAVVGMQDFADWGWRIPFLLSIILLLISVWIRTTLHESPVFLAMQRKGEVSREPLKEMFFQWRNLKILLVALFGLAAGQAIVINVGMTYSFFFLTQTLKLDFSTANILLAVALAVTAPLFVLFGALSDHVSRKKVILTGLALAIVGYGPIFRGLTHYGNPALEAAQANAPVTVIADPADCSFQFNPVSSASFRSSCDTAKAFLSRSGVPYDNMAAPTGTLARVEVGGQSVASFEGKSLASADFASKQKDFYAGLAAVVKNAGYPAAADPAQVNKPMIVVLLSLLMVLATMVYGPMAALLVEMFPARIRYSSVSTAYNIGNGWFGGFTSPVAFALIAASGNIYAGLWYCIGVLALTLVIGGLFLKPVHDDQEILGHEHKNDVPTEAKHVL